MNIEIFNHRFFANFKKYNFLLRELVKRDIKIKYRRSVLGIFWSFLEPLLSMVVLTIIFSTFFQRAIPNFPVYYLTGILVYQFFSEGTNGAMRSIKSSSSIIKTMYVPKYMYSLSSILSSFVTFLLSLVVLFIVMLATHVDFTIYMILAVLPFVALLLLTIGMGLIVATINVFFRDMEHLYGVFLMMLMWAMPIFYPANIVPESFRFIQYCNPLYAVISCCRSSFLYGAVYDPMQLLFAMVSGVVALIIGIALFYKYQDRFILYI
jgi:lipopolysaccharide transport system permease protein